MCEVALRYLDKIISPSCTNPYLARAYLRHLNYDDITYIRLVIGWATTRGNVPDSPQSWESSAIFEKKKTSTEIDTALEFI